MEHLLHVETDAAENEATQNMVLSLRMVFSSDNDHFSPNELVVNLEYESED